MFIIVNLAKKIILVLKVYFGKFYIKTIKYAMKQYLDFYWN